MKPECASIQMKAIEQYFHVVLFNYAAQGGSSLDETLVFDHSNESY